MCTGKNVDFEELFHSFQLDSTGETSFTELKRVAESYGLRSIPVHAGADLIGGLPAPFIAHVRSEGKAGDHFVLVLHASKEFILYIDPPQLSALETSPEFCQRWTGNALLLVKTESEERALKKTLFYSSLVSVLNPLLIGAFATMALLCGFVAWPMLAPHVVRTKRSLLGSFAARRT
jgi:ABC-type bacteriocin/lantibiotic exporter with double-glycine peptidase domain